MNEKTIENWIKLSEYDLKTADAMLQTGRYLYVAYMCQQSVEKLLKAIFVRKNSETPPYIHNLPRLSVLCGIQDNIPEMFSDFILELNTYYIESRYTEDLEELSFLINKEKAGNIYKITKDLILWLKKNYT